MRLALTGALAPRDRKNALSAVGNARALTHSVKKHSQTLVTYIKFTATEKLASEQEIGFGKPPFDFFK